MLTNLLSKSRIGIISDTHGLLRPEAINALQKCELIIHAGDIGKESVLDSLKEIAPVIAVRGNVDKDKWAKSLSLNEIVKIKNKNIYILHDINKINIEPRSEGVHVVISGHSHKPLEDMREGVLYLNPGSAGPRRFKLPVCVAIMEIESDIINIEFFNLI